ncbi:MAG: hypothetical protein LAT84_02720 [Balneolia bacterium]|nr:hypothetical protein [Balneolia bacterium]
MIRSVIYSFSLFVLAALSACSPNIPAAFDDLPDQLRFQHDFTIVPSDYTGAIVINQQRTRINLSDEELEAFQQVMDESEFFRHTDVYDKQFSGVLNSGGFYYPEGDFWVERVGFSMSGESFTTTVTPVVFNRQADALFTNPAEITFYENYVTEDQFETHVAVIDHMKYSSITRQTRRELATAYSRGEHRQNKPYRIGFFQNEVNELLREQVQLEYRMLSDLFKDVWKHEFVFAVTDEGSGSPIPNAELVIHQFTHEGTSYGRFAFFREITGESPFQARYLRMFNQNDETGLVIHNLESDENGIVRLIVPLHPEWPSPLLSYSIKAEGYSTLSEDTQLDQQQFSIQLIAE